MVTGARAVPNGDTGGGILVSPDGSYTQFPDMASANAAADKINFSQGGSRYLPPELVNQGWVIMDGGEKDTLQQRAILNTGGQLFRLPDGRVAAKDFQNSGSDPALKARTDAGGGRGFFDALKGFLSSPAAIPLGLGLGGMLGGGDFLQNLFTSGLDSGASAFSSGIEGLASDSGFLPGSFNLGPGAGLTDASWGVNPIGGNMDDFSWLDDLFGGQDASQMNFNFDLTPDQLSQWGIDNGIADPGASSKGLFDAFKSNNPGLFEEDPSFQTTNATGGPLTQSTTGTSLWDKLLKAAGIGGGATGTGGQGNLLTGLGALASYFANKDAADAQRAAAERAAQLSDPFASQRGMYQGMLSNSYNDPNFFATNPVFNGLQDLAMQKTNGLLSSQGFNGSGNQMKELTKTATNEGFKYALPFQAQLAQNAGAGISPGYAGYLSAQGQNLATQSNLNAQGNLGTAIQQTLPFLSQAFTGSLT